MNLPATQVVNPSNQPAAIAAGQFLTFMLSGKMYAFSIVQIKEILGYGLLTTVPMMPGYIRGVINLRGAVVPVVDLSARFGSTQSEVTKRSCIVIIEVNSGDGRQDIGVITDTVSEVLSISAEDLTAPPMFGATIRTDFMAGMAKFKDKFVIILNVDKVLSVDELAMVGDAAQQAIFEPLSVASQ
jgi:purine-binding chemotaxis protein CheW